MTLKVVQIILSTLFGNTSFKYIKICLTAIHCHNITIVSGFLNVTFASVGVGTYLQSSILYLANILFLINGNSFNISI